jgi:glycosyltransferase involved in cell wall biosynthesis
MKKKVLILTLNDYVIYQPTILNLYDFLLPDFDVTVISFQPKFATKQKDASRNIIYLETNFWMSQLYTKLDFVLSKLAKFRKLVSPRYEYYYHYYQKYLPRILKNALKKQKNNAGIIIAVDFPALHVAQQIFGAVHFLSLEIDNNRSRYYRLVDPGKVKSVVVQSQARYDYLFPGVHLKTFIVPNCPTFIPVEKNKQERKDFIWAGAIDRRLAVMECIAFFNEYPQYKLVLKGGGDIKTQRLIQEKYDGLLKTGRIAIDRNYLPERSFIEFLSGFRIGFCFYAWSLIRDSFNYQTAPSGKLLMYMAAGIPVIACNIPGFQFIREAGAGVLVDNYDPVTILMAVQKIEADYQQYVSACFKVAEANNFGECVKPYLDFLKKE